ncbi:ankyrin [Penicillium herquei]|nr:ankyrin [Penicillium herquei]
MKILLDHGADPTIKDLDGFNALEYAASLDLEFTLLLVGHVSVNNLANYILERGPIRLALRAGNLPVLKFWLDLTFNWKELDQMLILLLASFADELEFLRGQPATQLFISHIDVDSLLQYFLSSESEAHSSSWGYSLIKLARGIPTLARRLLENNLLDSEMKKDLFYEAAEHGRVDFMNLLTAHGVNGEEYHKKPIGLSCLSWMSPGKPGTKAFAKWLVETDTGPYEIHSDHALRALFCLGDMAILRKYLDTWNVPEETKLRGISNSIYLSIHRESSAIFDFCLESGVKLNPRNPSHDTAFQESVRAGAMPVIKRFLDAGFDVNGDYQSTCMSYLVYTGEYPDYSVLYEAFSEDDIEVSIKTVTFLLEHGADLEKKLTHKYFNFNDAVAKKKQRTCLLRLIKKSHEEARNAMICRGVKFLLEQGADPFSRTTAGETALVLAVKQDFLSVTKVILEFFDETGMSFDKIKKMIRGSVACGLNMPGKKYNETTRFLYRYYWRRVHAVPT